MEAYGFSLGEDEDEEEQYTTKINIPQYEITGDCPALSELFDDEKTNELIEEIQQSNVTDEEKEFLLKAARRHTAFNYANIAEYYAHASEEMQGLMEKSALIIIDYKDAIRNGYVNLSAAILRMLEEDGGEPNA
jgi:F0F1-type ATP synthase delta subunit